MQAVLTAVEQVVDAEGVEGLTVRRVATRAGVALGSVYQYYASREALVADWELRAHERLAEVVMTAAVDAARQAKEPEEAIRSTVLAGFDAVGAHFRRYRTSEMPTSSLQKRLALLGPMAETLAGLLGAGALANRLRPRHLAIALRVALMASAYGALSAEKSELMESDRRIWRESVADMVVASLLRDRAQEECPTQLPET